MNAHTNLSVPVASATAAVNAFVDRMAPQPYSRTTMILALLRAAERLATGPGAICGPVRDVIADEACQTWARISGETDRMARRG